VTPHPIGGRDVLILVVGIALTLLVLEAHLRGSRRWCALALVAAAAFCVLVLTSCARPTRWPAPRRFHPERWPIDSAAILPATDPHDRGVREKLVFYD
jgi:hypothetical protein